MSQLLLQMYSNVSDENTLLTHTNYKVFHILLTPCTSVQPHVFDSSAPVCKLLFHCISYSKHTPTRDSPDVTTSHKHAAQKWQQNLDQIFGTFHWTDEHLWLEHLYFMFFFFLVFKSLDILHKHLTPPFSSALFTFCTYLRQDLDGSYFFLPPTSSGMNTLTVKSPLSVPYLFFTRMLYLPESDTLTAVMVKLANFPDSNLRMQCSSDAISFSFFSQVTSGWGSPEMLQVRLRAWGDDQKLQSLNEGVKYSVYVYLYCTQQGQVPCPPGWWPRQANLQRLEHDLRKGTSTLLLFFLTDQNSGSQSGGRGVIVGRPRGSGG